METADDYHEFKAIAEWRRTAADFLDIVNEVNENCAFKPVNDRRQYYLVCETHSIGVRSCSSTGLVATFATKGAHCEV
jgi:hypothetical protein